MLGPRLRITFIVGASLLGFSGRAHCASLSKVLKLIRANSSVYHVPLDQDTISRGLYPEPPQSDGRSEKVYPPYILSARRQTDSLVRQAYELLPESVRAATAFVIADRLMQFPEQYLDYLRAHSEVVLVGSFVGVGRAPAADPWVYDRHENELWKLKMSLQLIHALHKKVRAVLYSMGDSNSGFGRLRREELQHHMDTILDHEELSPLKRRISWGADESILTAFASVLPPVRASLRISNPHALQHYDSLSEAQEVIQEKSNEVGLSWDESHPEIHVWVYTRRPISDLGPDNETELTAYQSDDETQAHFDAGFSSEINRTPASEWNKTVIIDARTFNGAWDALAVPHRCDLLAYGSWGTFGNVAGATLALAKLLYLKGESAVTRQMFLEAVGHDVFANGYAEAQRGALRDKVNAAGIPFRHYDGYSNELDVTKVFDILNDQVNTRLQQTFSGTDCMLERKLRITPQNWRTFESEVHLWPQRPGEIFAPGVYRKDLPARSFDPELR